MKKVLSATIMALIITIGFTSCRKCEICTKDNEPDIRVCEGDYNSKTEYGLTIDGYEFSGYHCR